MSSLVAVRARRPRPSPASSPGGRAASGARDRRDVPEPAPSRQLVRRDQPPVGRERHRLDVALAAPKHVHRVAPPRRPEVDRAVAPRAAHELAVRRERDADDRAAAGTSCASGRPRTRHSQTVPSSAAGATSVPSGLKRAGSRRRARQRARARRRTTRQIRTAPSPPAVDDEAPVRAEARIGTGPGRGSVCSCRRGHPPRSGRSGLLRPRRRGARPASTPRSAPPGDASPSSGIASSALASQSRMPRSMPPVAMRVPLGLKASALAPPSFAGSVAITLPFSRESYPVERCGGRLASASTGRPGSTRPRRRSRCAGRK